MYSNICSYLRNKLIFFARTYIARQLQQPSYITHTHTETGAFDSQNRRKIIIHKYLTL